MRLFHLELASEPVLTIQLHPRLTVVSVDDPTRARLVGALDQLLRGRATELRGQLVGDGGRADFMVESTSGPVLPGVPVIVRATDITATLAASASDPLPGERAEARHAHALEELERAEAARDAHERVVDALRERRVRAMQALEHAHPVAPDEHDDTRKRLRGYVEELDLALQAPSLTDRERVELLERGTLLAGDASRLGICPPTTVRALLDAVDTLSRVPSLVPGGGNGTAPVPATAIAIVRKVLADLEVEPVGTTNPSTTELVRVEAELRDAQALTEGLDRAAGAARSRALAVFAELEAVRRATPDDSVPMSYGAALRARLARRIPTTWVGVAPIIVDDALAECPRADIADARAALLEAGARAQVVFLTGDPDHIAWAGRLPPADGAVAVPGSR